MSPKKSTEEKAQSVIRKIKSKLTIQEYKRFYHSGCCPGKFYGTAKLHKIASKRPVDDLPIRPIISNINTSTYNLSTYMAKLESQYSIKITKDFMNKIKNKKTSNVYQIVSFDVKSLFIIVPLDQTI